MPNQFERELRRAWRMKEGDVDRAHQLQGKTVASALRLGVLFFGRPLCVAAAVIVAVAVHDSDVGLDRQLSTIDSELRILQAIRNRAAATGLVPAFLDRKIQVLRARRDELRDHRDELREQRRDEGVVFPVGGGAQAAPLTAGSDFAKAGHHTPRTPQWHPPPVELSVQARTRSAGPTGPAASAAHCSAIAPEDSRRRPWIYRPV